VARCASYKKKTHLRLDCDGLATTTALTATTPATSTTSAWATTTALPLVGIRAFSAPVPLPLLLIALLLIDIKASAVMPENEECGLAFRADGVGITIWARPVLGDREKTGVAPYMPTRCLGDIIWWVVAYSALSWVDEILWTGLF